MRQGQERAIVMVALIAVPVAPLRVYAPGPVPLAIGAFHADLALPAVKEAGGRCCRPFFSNCCRGF
ncbi:hypothetical protein FFR93_12170 [Rhizobium sp. MHM7A]|nr:hypothetical protein FFR93_12170 [Rhizobium sp. MHM7A]